MRILARSPDHKFTYSYSQPAEYRFCQDSVIFPRLIAEKVRLAKDARVLDLCAGCGVIGFELAHHLPHLQNLDFVEIQDAFLPHLRENMKITGQDFRILHMNYRELPADTYDLIVANPPYFLPEQGRHSPVEINQRARFFMDASFDDLLTAVRRALRPDGEAYLLIKPDRAHGGEVVADVRGTHVVRINRGLNPSL